MYQIIICSVSVYLFMVAAIRLFGKKELAQLSVTDLVFILLISNSVQNAMVGNNSTLWGGLVAATSLFVVNWALKNLMFRFPGFNKVLQGSPVPLIIHGEIQYKNLLEAKVTLDELSESVREHGYDDKNLAKIDLAMLEIDGNISVLSEGFTRKTLKKRKARKSLTQKISG